MDRIDANFAATEICDGFIALKEKPSRIKERSNPMTSTEILALIEEYIAARNEPDPSVRLEFLETIWHDEGTYTDPTSHAENRAGLDAIIEGFLGDNPGAKFILNEKFDYHHGHVRFDWMLHLPGGTETRGMDYGEVSPDGKLIKIVRFF